MIGQRVRQLERDGPIHVGWEGVVTRHHSSGGHGLGEAYYVKWDAVGFECPTYETWFKPIAYEPDETEGFFV